MNQRSRTLPIGATAAVLACALCAAKTRAAPANEPTGAPIGAASSSADPTAAAAQPSAAGSVAVAAPSAMVSAASAVGSASPAPSAVANAPSPPKSAPYAPGERRALPEYGAVGAPERAPSPALLPLRILLAPAYFVSEYIVNRPLGALFTLVERDRFPRVLWDLLSGPSTVKLTIVPSALIEFGFRPSVGAYAFWDEALHKDNDLRLYAVTWGSRWLDTGVADRIHLGGRRTEGPRSFLWLRGEYVRREDRVFHGLGPRARTEDISRFRSELGDVNVGLEHRNGGALRLRGFVGYRAHDYGPSNVDDDEPSIEQAATAGLYPLPPGYERGFGAGYLRADATLDTRRDSPGAHDPVEARVELEGRASWDPGSNAAWAHYQATGAAFFDVTGTRRVLGLMASLLFADPISGELPFTERALLGGSRNLRAFRTGRLIDRSAAVVAASWEWPVWLLLNGFLTYSVGNVFGPQLAGFTPGLLRQDVEFGLRVADTPDHQLELLFGFGSRPFDEGSRFDSTRVFIGLTRGF